MKNKLVLLAFAGSLAACASKPNRVPSSVVTARPMMIHFKSPGPDPIDVAALVNANIGGPTIGISEARKDFSDQVQSTSSVVPNTIRLNGSYEAAIEFFQGAAPPVLSFWSENDHATLSAIIPFNRADVTFNFMVSEARTCTARELGEKRALLNSSQRDESTRNVSLSPRISEKCFDVKSRSVPVAGITVAVNGSTDFSTIVTGKSVKLALTALVCKPTNQPDQRDCQTVKKNITEETEDMDTVTLDERLREARALVEAINGGASIEEALTRPR